MKFISRAKLAIYNFFIKSDIDVVERLAIYEKLKKTLEEQQGGSYGFCHILGVLYHKGETPKIYHVSQFPELMLYRPYKLLWTGYWFVPGDKKIRISILDKEILFLKNLLYVK